MKSMSQDHQKGLSYRDAGVDIDAGNALVERIKPHAKRTARKESLGAIGGFGALFKIPKGYQSPVLVSGTDGVGTKLKLAIDYHRHSQIGEDLVAMCVNDLIVANAEPLFFLDYYATGHLDIDVAESVIASIAHGYELSGCALAGGETAEMPGMYGEADYDLAGFAVGFAKSKDELILGKNIQPGMKVYGFPSSGIHSNGYSLIRKIFGIDLENPEKTKEILNQEYPELGRTLGEELLEPTIIYVDQVKKLLAKYKIAGFVHVTGGGLVENPPRVLPDGCGINFKMGSWQVPPIFKLIQKKGNISEQEMLRTFNYGIGLIAISSDDIPEGIQIGEVVEGDKKINFLK